MPEISNDVELDIDSPIPFVPVDRTPVVPMKSLNVVRNDDTVPYLGLVVAYFAVIGFFVLVMLAALVTAR